MIPTLVVIARSVSDEAIQGTLGGLALWIASLREAMTSARIRKGLS
jgi:hypothetical protein